MAKYLIDVNLPYYFSLWRAEDYVDVRDLGDGWSDSRVWSYAERFGNLKMQAFYRRIVEVWDETCELSAQYRLVNVFVDRLEGID